MSRLRSAPGRLRHEHGQTAVEYLGMILILAIVVGVVARSDIDGKIARGVRDQVCNVLGDSCDRNEKKATRSKDTDKDGVADYIEKKRGTRPARKDTDLDGLSDGEEAELGTSPLRPDTDRDGMRDGDEQKRKTDPKDRKEGGRGRTPKRE